MCLSHECIQSETKGLQMYGHPWNLDPPKGFVGFREDLPCRLYRRRLPHWRQPGASYFCTYRLVDSLPQWRLDELKRLREEWTRKHLNSENAKSLQDLDELIYQRIEYWLDQGMGSCVLGKDQASLSIHRSMQHFHSTRYELGASVVMPNHVHCIVRPFESPSYELEDILGGWKSFSAHEINQAFERDGPLWLEETYDRIIRDEEHLWRCIQYIGSNPKRAGLTAAACRLWINPEWESLGWRFL